MNDASNSVEENVQRSRSAMVLQLAGLGDIVIGIGAGFVGPMLAPGMDAIWWIIAAALAVGGLMMILIGRRMDPGNRAR